MLISGTVARDSDVAARGLRAVRHGAVRRPRRRRPRGRHGLPDDARADHGAVVRAGPDEVDRALVRASAARSRRSARCFAGLLLEHFSWGSVFLITLPLAVVALVMAWLLRARPRQRDGPSRSTTSAASSRCVLVGALILAINFAPVPNATTLTLGLAGDRRRRARRASTSGSAARRTRSTTSRSPRGRTFWVAACAGIIVFGSLMGAMFIGQQFLQNVLGYSTLDAGRAILPAALLHGARRAAVGEARRGPRRPLHAAHRLRLRACSAS